MKVGDCVQVGEAVDPEKGPPSPTNTTRRPGAFGKIVFDEIFPSGRQVFTVHHDAGGWGCYFSDELLHRSEQLPEKLKLLGRLLDGRTNEQLAAELPKHGFSLAELWELGIAVDSALRAARRLRRKQS
jgi:hypothetical protein